MKWSRFYLLVLLFPALLLAQNSKVEENGSFVKILCDQEKLVVGDSCLLTYVVYAPQPFQMKGEPDKMRVRNAHWRKLPIGRQQLQRVVEGRYIYYALVLEQYVVRSEQSGEIVIPARTFDLEMQVQERSEDPFDAFWGRPGKVRKLPARTESSKLVLKVVEKPRRTMMEMKRSGLQVV